MHCSRTTVSNRGVAGLTAVLEMLGVDSEDVGIEIKVKVIMILFNVIVYQYPDSKD